MYRSVVLAGVFKQKIPSFELCRFQKYILEQMTFRKVIDYFDYETFLHI